MSVPTPSQPLLPYERPMVLGELRVNGGGGAPVQVRWVERTSGWGRQLFWLALFAAGSVAWLGHGVHRCLTSPGGWTRWLYLLVPGLWSFMYVCYLAAVAGTRIRHCIMQADREAVLFADDLDEGGLPTSWVRTFEIQPRPGGHALILIPFPRPQDEIRWYQVRWQRPPKLGPFDVVVHGDEDLLRRAARELNALLTPSPDDRPAADDTAAPEPTLSQL